MDKKERYALYDRAVSAWGEEAQYDQLIEEMSELCLACSKIKRQMKGEYKDQDLESNFIEEICDVYMCLELFIKKYGEQKLKQIFEEKLLKFKKQIEIKEKNKKN